MFLRRDNSLITKDKDIEVLVHFILICKVEQGQHYDGDMGKQ